MRGELGRARGVRGHEAERERERGREGEKTSEHVGLRGCPLRPRRPNRMGGGRAEETRRGRPANTRVGLDAPFAFDGRSGGRQAGAGTKGASSQRSVASRAASTAAGPCSSRSGETAGSAGSQRTRRVAPSAAAAGA